jgi:hypothetical protein
MKRRKTLKTNRIRVRPAGMIIFKEVDRTAFLSDAFLKVSVVMLIS